MREQFPLVWPPNTHRTLIGARKTKGQWKLTKRQYMLRLEDELKKMGVKHAVLTSNVQPGGEDKVRDPSVALYFTRPPADDDFSWQETLGITNPDPKLEEIEKRFMDLMKQSHTDVPGGDLELAKSLNEARKRAKAFVSGDWGKENELCMPCDRYHEVKHNIAAIAFAISYLRRLEDLGVPGILDRAFAGFRAELPENSESSYVAARS